PKRPDLKIIVTSATIDPDSFAAHFADVAGTPAPIVEVSGRTFPVEIRYRPLSADVEDDADDDFEGAVSRRPAASSTGKNEERDLGDAVFDALAELAREEPGDALVFLAGEADIRDVADTIESRSLPGTEVLPLYGRLSA